MKLLSGQLRSPNAFHRTTEWYQLNHERVPNYYRMFTKHLPNDPTKPLPILKVVSILWFTDCYLMSEARRDIPRGMITERLLNDYGTLSQSIPNAYRTHTERLSNTYRMLKLCLWYLFLFCCSLMMAGHDNPRSSPDAYRTCTERLSNDFTERFYGCSANAYRTHAEPISNTYWIRTF